MPHADGAYSMIAPAPVRSSEMLPVSVGRSERFARVGAGQEARHGAVLHSDAAVVIGEQPRVVAGSSAGSP